MSYDAWNLKEVQYIKDKKKFIRCITYKLSFKVSVRSEGPYTLYKKQSFPLRIFSVNLIYLKNR